MRLFMFAIVLVMTWRPVITVSAQMPPSAKEIANYSGLLSAAHNNNIDAIRAILAGGGDPNPRDGMKRTPVHIAAYASNPMALRILVAGGADINAFERDRYDVMTIAAVKDDLAMVKLCIELGGNAGAVTSLYDGTALIAAAHLGHVEVVKTLINAKAPLDHINNLGWTALMEAVVLGNGSARYVATVQALVDAGAIKSIADRSGVMPLQHARALGFDAIVAILK